ncbi:family 78 glycoside hydrolase catalytic domain, partial [Escherichia coli]|nr:family 78 glycoside hydrolase catalytic domain [Escherichia coli]
ASIEKLRIHPQIRADYSARVCEHEVFEPQLVKRSDNGELIYDFGQNFAGIVRFSVRDAREGQVITVKHAEILNPDGSLNMTFLRTAKAQIVYT